MEPLPFDLGLWCLCVIVPLAVFGVPAAIEVLVNGTTNDMTT